MRIKQREKKIANKIKSWARSNEGIQQLDKFSDRSTLSMVLLGGLLMEIVKLLIEKYTRKPIRGLVAAITGVIVANIVWGKVMETEQKVEREVLREKECIEKKVGKIERNLERKMEKKR